MRNLCYKLILCIVFAATLFFLCDLCISCENICFHELKVENVIVNNESIILNFSKEVNRNSLIDSFTFSCDKENIEGRFLFEKTSVTFYPVEMLEDGHDYSISILQSLEDLDGISLTENYKYDFTKKSESNPPEVLSIFPEDSFISIEEITQIDIKFSETVDIKSFEKAFTMNPACDYRLIWNEDCDFLEVKFNKELKRSTLYRVTINNSLKDLNNNHQLNTFNSVFTNAFDDECPDYTIHYTQNDEIFELDSENINEGIMFDSLLEITFSEAVQIDSVQNFITVKPELALKFETDNISKNKVNISFSKISECGNTKYFLTVNKGIKDESGNESLFTKSYTLVFNNEANRPPELLKSYLILDDNVLTFSNRPEDNYQLFLLDKEKFPYDKGEHSKLIYVFRISNLSNKLDYKSVLKAFSIEVTNYCLSILIHSINLLTNDDLNLAVEIPESLSLSDEFEGNLCVVVLNLEIENLNQNGLVRFCIDKSLADDYGNRLQNNIEVTFNKL